MRRAGACCDLLSQIISVPFASCRVVGVSCVSDNYHNDYCNDNCRINDSNPDHFHMATISLIISVLATIIVVSTKARPPMTSHKRL